jgi:hypothetical protein
VTKSIVPICNDVGAGVVTVIENHGGFEFEAKTA